MVRLPIFKSRELVKIVEKKGFVAVRQSGSHRIFKHPDGRWTTIPIHPTTIGRGLLKKIIKDIGELI